MATLIGGPEDFLRAARQLSIDPMSYPLDGGHRDGRYVLGRAGQVWVVYYSEHGLAKGTETFVTQTEALAFLLRVLKGDPTTRLPMTPSSTVTVLCAAGRLLLTPQRNQMLRTAEDFASSRVTSINAPGAELASDLRDLLVLLPMEPTRMIPNSPEAKRAQARHRTGMMKTFGVARTTDWITDARCVLVQEDDGWMRFTPSHRKRPKQELFVWMPADRTITVPASDKPSNVSAALLDRAVRGGPRGQPEGGLSSGADHRCGPAAARRSRSAGEGRPPLAGAFDCAPALQRPDSGRAAQ